MRRRRQCAQGAGVGGTPRTPTVGTAPDPRGAAAGSWASGHRAGRPGTGEGRPAPQASTARSSSSCLAAPSEGEALCWGLGTGHTASGQHPARPPLARNPTRAHAGSLVASSCRSVSGNQYQENNRVHRKSGTFWLLKQVRCAGVFVQGHESHFVLVISENVREGETQEAKKAVKSRWEQPRGGNSVG